MTRPTSDERWASAAITPDERRSLDRHRRAYVVHHDGGYGVTDGMATVPAYDLDDAKRIEFVHNIIGAQTPETFAPLASLIQGLRDPQREAPAPLHLHVVPERPTDDTSGDAA